MLVSTLVEEGERRATEAERLQQELIRARIAEKQAKEKLGTFIQSINGSISHSIANSTALNASLLNASHSLLNSSTPHLPASSSISHGSVRILHCYLLLCLQCVLLMFLTFTLTYFPFLMLHCLW